MENQEVKAPENVSYFTFESVRATMERTIKRLWILLLVLVGLLVATNAGWMIYESQFEEIEITQDNANGYNNYVGNDGDIYNGETDHQNPTP